jgi:predicted alpha/beta hydrolase family esterase
MKKPQLIYVHGGRTYKKYEDYIQFIKNRKIKLTKRKKWHETYLYDALKENVEIYKIEMPCKLRAQYFEWKITFEKYLEQVENNFILIGVSLGASFLAKYLSENKISKKIISVNLVATTFDNSMHLLNKEEEELTCGFALEDGADLSLILENCKQTRLIYSKDDSTVLPEHADLFKKNCPELEIHILEGKNGHFMIEEFPEIIDWIKKDLKLIST